MAEAQPQADLAGQVESLVRFELGCGFHTLLVVSGQGPGFSTLPLIRAALL